MHTGGREGTSATLARTFGDWLAEDMLFAAFALGVAWATESAAPCGVAST